MRPVVRNVADRSIPDILFTDNVDVEPQEDFFVHGVRELSDMEEFMDHDDADEEDISWEVPLRETILEWTPRLLEDGDEDWEEWEDEDEEYVLGPADIEELQNLEVHYKPYYMRFWSFRGNSLHTFVTLTNYAILRTTALT